MGKLSAIVFSLLFAPVALAKAGALLEAQVGSAKLQMEVVESMEDRARGLMYREKLPANQGMLFIFESEQPLTFWMKNTLIPLSIAYLNNQLEIVDIQDMDPAPAVVREPPRYPSRKPAQFALEVNQGWFKRQKVHVGDRLKLLQAPASPLLKRFFEASRLKSQPRPSGD